jgi:hypothetical protein
MLAERYPNLRQLFHAPGEIPPAEFAADHKLTAEMERKFTGTHGKARCPYCQLQHNDPSPTEGPSSDTLEEDAIQWLEQSRFNPFNAERRFADWLGCYTDRLRQSQCFEDIHQADEDGMLLQPRQTALDRVFFSLLQEMDLVQLKTTTKLVNY